MQCFCGVLCEWKQEIPSECKQEEPESQAHLCEMVCREAGAEMSLDHVCKFSLYFVEDI